MIKARQIRKTGLPLFLVLVVVIPLLVGQSCPPINKIAPVIDVDNNGGGGDDSGKPKPDGSNEAPFFEFTSPSTDVIRDIGESLIIRWRDSDPDDSAVITLSLAPNGTSGITNQIVIASSIPEDPDGVIDDAYILNTGALSLQMGEYLLIATINDGVNAAQQVVAPGLLRLFLPGMVAGNLSPTVVVTEPMRNLAVIQGETVPIEWCVSDPDDGENDVVPDIVILLDLDDDPNNDLDLSGLDAEETVADVCFAVEDPADGPYAIVVNGQTRAYVIGCTKDKIQGQIGECNGANAIMTPFPPSGFYTIDAMEIPPRANGEPYRVRVTAWDHTNSAVSRYAFGSVTVAPGATGAGVVDLAQVGRTVSGSKFYGNDLGGLTGSSGIGVGDMDGDGVEDFTIVSQFGRGYGMDAMGSVHLVLGLPNGQKFGQEVPLNSISTTYGGSQFTMPYSTKTDGIMSIARVGDVTGDGLSEFIIGAPYVEILYDRVDDDPCDAPPGPLCYYDYMPNPRSDNAEPDEMGAYDWHEDAIFYDPEPEPPLPLYYLCANDQDLSVQTPINSGYAILVGSNNSLVHDIWGLEDMGQYPGPPQEPYGPIHGARWRGAYWDDLDLPELYDIEKRTWPYSIIPDNLFGQTVNSMPSISNSTPGLTARWGPSTLLSSPNSGRGRGRVWYFEGFDYTHELSGSSGPDIQSFPGMVGCGFRTRIIPGGSDGTGRSGSQVITGEVVGDHLGYASPAGDFNLDGAQDIVCGAPGAERNNLTKNGIVYVIFGRPDFNNPDMTNLEEFDLDIWNMPRVEIHGKYSNDRYGEVQTLLGDIDQDGLPDVAFASQYAGSDGVGGPESGFIGIMFGGRRLTGENVFTVDEVGGPQLPGVRIYGSQAGGHAGAVINNAGDFNADGIDDLLIVAPDEIRTINGLQRKGVAYLIFAGPHLAGRTISLSQVGSTSVPGLVFVTPYVTGSADEAAITWANAAGDVNSDGFADILIGIPNADFVYPNDPNQRRVDSGEMYLIYGNNAGSNSVGG